MDEAMCRFRQIGAVHVQESDRHSACGTENGNDQAPEAEGARLGARSHSPDDIGTESDRE
jgi:hypothetical protein